MEDTRTVIDPADYFSPDAPVPEQALLRKIWYPAVLGSFGFFGTGLGNLLARRPFYSGIQRHIIFGSVGLVLGIQLDRWTKKRTAFRDNVYYHYILSHPEDFPPIERKKYSEVLLDWVPIR